MRRYKTILLASLVLAFALGSFAGTTFKASTTLTAQTTNNTSAAGTFTTLTDGDLGASNVSKLPIRDLLYPGSTAKIYVHLVAWFGDSDHMNVGYNSDNPSQIQSQFNDMVSRGADGLILDWYGQGTMKPEFVSYNQVFGAFLQQAEAQGNFNVAIMDDAGSLLICSQTSGCDVTQTLINDLTYAYNNWENSPAYLHFNGRPVVYFFGQEAYTIDWTQVRASVPGNPLFIFRNAVGFNYAESNGGFSWVAPETVSSTDPMALLYLDGFDQTAVSLAPAYATSSAFKGFNDSLASWGTGRLIGQQCGQTWLASMAEQAKYYSHTQQLLGLQVVTWNDYEEGTEIESGVDNCVTVNASTSGTVVNWSITGEINTVDHFTVYASQDGEDLMWLADVPTSASSLDIKQFQLDSGEYTMFVQAVGKPSLTNKMSAAANLTIPNQPPVAVLSVSPASGSAPLNVAASTEGSTDPDGNVASTVINFGDGSPAVSAGSASHTYNAVGSYTVTATVTDNLGASTSKTTTVIVSAAASPAPQPPQSFFFSSSSSSATVAAGQAANYSLALSTGSSGFTGAVSLSCSGAPAGTTCSVGPTMANFTGSVTSVPISVTVATTQQARRLPLWRNGLPFVMATVLFGLGLSGAMKKRGRYVLVAVMAMMLMLGLIGCGGAASSMTTAAPQPAGATNAMLTLTGASGSQTASTILGLTITQ